MSILALMGLLAPSPQRQSPQPFQAAPRRVDVIELFTSEGCSSCPPAEQWLGALGESPGLWREFVPLEFHVSYWVGLGWRDRLASRESTARQFAYASAWGRRNVYTPCFVRNGAEWRPFWGGPGTAGGAAGTLRVELGGDGVCRVEFLPGKAAEGLEAHVALPGGGISSRVTAGENSGETLRHEFVVLGLSGGPLAPDAAGPGLRAALALPKASVPDARRRALAAWVTRRGELEPLQATGGWLP